MADVVRIPWPDLTAIESVEELNRILDARRKQVQHFLEDHAERKELVISADSPLGDADDLPLGNVGDWLPGNAGAWLQENVGGVRPGIKTVKQVRDVHAPKNSSSVYVDVDASVLSKLTDSIDVTVEDEMWLSLPSPLVLAAEEGGTGESAVEYLEQMGADPELLRVETGTGIIVSVIDSGIDTKHDEFSEVHFNLENSFDYLNDDAEAGIIVPIKLPPGKAIADRHYHGTAVTGLLAGKSTGVARGCTIYSHNIFYHPSKKVRRLLQQQGRGDVTRTRLEMALMYSIIHKADIICMSLGVPGRDDRFRREIADAVGQNRLIVAASGNDGLQTHRSPGDYPEVLSVGAVDSNDNVWHKTSATSLKNKDGSVYWYPDIYAPGVNLRVPVPPAINASGYIVASGTSLAAPLVAGAASLLLGWHRARGKPITPAKVKAHLLETADCIDVPEAAGGGKGKRINVARAMKALN